MNNLKNVVMVALLPLLVVFVNCAGSQMVQRQALNTNLRPYSTVIVSVESKVTDEDVQKETSELEGQILSKIQALKTFQDVRLGEGSESSAGTLLVKVSITKIRKVSGTTRFIAGAFAGKASMTADVVLIDAANGKTLGSYEITGKSGSTGLSGGTGDAVAKTAESIAKVISENYTR